MRRRAHRGFTIIEISLFLAISGFLLLITVLGMGPEMKNQQFASSMHGIADYINQQYNEIQSGVNNRNNDITCIKSGDNVVVSGGGTSQAGASANCVLLGRIYTFNSTGITANDVVGAVSNGCSSNSSDPAPVQALEKACATTITDNSFNSAQDLSYSWGSTLQHGKGRIPNSGNSFDSGDSADYGGVTGFGIYRSPSDGNIFTVLYNDTTALATDNINAQFCFEGQAAYQSAIYFGGSYDNGGAMTGSNNLVNVKIDDNSCANSGWSS